MSKRAPSAAGIDVTNLRHHEVVRYPGAMSKRTPSPAGMDDPSDDGSRSPELKMLFVDEAEGDGPEAAVAGHGRTEDLEGEGRASRWEYRE